MTQVIRAEVSAVRTAKKRIRNEVFVDSGHLFQADPNYGLSVTCYVCDIPHKALGLAQIRNSQETNHVALCERCLAAADNDAVLRKFLNTPNLEIRQGGEATTEQVMAMAEKPDAT